jgi:hypothetical protein
MVAVLRAVLGRGHAVLLCGEVSSIGGQRSRRAGGRLGCV